jgi:type IV pilus assembly protein PilA
VVGIIGILVAIAAPNFSRYQSKARQSEAKIALAAVYGSEKSFYSEYSAYISSMDAIGYAPEGQRRYYGVGWNAVHGSAINGYGGATTTAAFVEQLNPFTGCGTAPGLAANLTGDAQTFMVAAAGCIRQGSGSYDQWNINDTKILSNNVISL